MQTRIHRWGNSLALRIPRTFAAEVGLSHDALVEISLVDGKLVIAPVREPAPTLDQLLAGITDDNLHAGIDTGPAVGNEAWADDARP